MTDSDDATRLPSGAWLPPNVSSALNISAVAAIRTLRENHGVGLYEAKQIVDAYLERHPAHPLALRQTQSATQSPASARKTFEQYRDSLLATSPEPGDPIPLEALPNRIRPPAYYVVVRRANAADEHPFPRVLRACLDSVVNQDCVELVDEEYGPTVWDTVGMTVKLIGPITGHEVSGLMEQLERICSPTTSWRVVRGRTAEELAIGPKDLKVEYFLREHARESHLWPTVSCVRLTHHPSGLVARATSHRQKLINYEEAIYILDSLLKDSGHAIAD